MLQKTFNGNETELTCLATKEFLVLIAEDWTEKV